MLLPKKASCSYFTCNSFLSTTSKCVANTYNCHLIHGVHIHLHANSFCISLFSPYARLLVISFKAREREMIQKLEEKDGESYQMKETHSTLQEEVDIKTKKLKKVSAF